MSLKRKLILLAALATALLTLTSCVSLAGRVVQRLRSDPPTLETPVIVLESTPSPEPAPETPIAAEETLIPAQEAISTQDRGELAGEWVCVNILWENQDFTPEELDVFSTLTFSSEGIVDFVYTNFDDLRLDEYGREWVWEDTLDSRHIAFYMRDGVLPMLDGTPAPWWVRIDGSSGVASYGVLDGGVLTLYRCYGSFDAADGMDPPGISVMTYECNVPRLPPEVEVVMEEAQEGDMLLAWYNPPEEVAMWVGPPTARLGDGGDNVLLVPVRDGTLLQVFNVNSEDGVVFSKGDEPVVEMTLSRGEVLALDVMIPEGMPSMCVIAQCEADGDTQYGEMPLEYNGMESSWYTFLREGGVFVECY